MKRRELITLLGGAAAWPLAARAQQSAIRMLAPHIQRAEADARNLATMWQIITTQPAKSAKES